MGLADARHHPGEPASAATARPELVEPVSPSSRSRLVPVPTRSLQPRQRVAGEEVLGALEGDEQLLAGAGEALAEVVAWAGTLWLRPVITVSRCSTARSASTTSAATMRSRMSSSERRDLQLLDVLREVPDVIALWTCSWPARAENSSTWPSRGG